MIGLNEHLDDIEKIWQENNKGYVGYNCNQRSLKDKDMLKVVYVNENQVFGYAVLYFKKDFCELENYPNKLKDIPNKVIYIWEIITDKNHIKKGVAIKIFKYIKEKYQGYTIYSCIDLTNIPSLNLHKKMNFKIEYYFEDERNNKYVMMSLSL